MARISPSSCARPPVLLGAGAGGQLSPDRKWVLASSANSPVQLLLFPTGAGELRRLTNDQIDHGSATWLPDGKHIVFSGSEPGRPQHLYVQDLEGGSPTAISAEGYSVAGLILPDGEYAVILCPDFKACLFPLAGGEPRAIPGLESVDVPIQWTGDGRALYTYRFGKLPSTVERVDVATGKRTPWRMLAPADLAGVHWHLADRHDP